MWLLRVDKQEPSSLVFVTHVPHRPPISLRPNYTVTPGTFATIVVVQQAMRYLVAPMEDFSSSCRNDRTSTAKRKPIG
jgi:hypothetical protein